MFIKSHPENSAIFLPSPVIGDDVYIHLMGAFCILSQVADGFPMRLLVAVNPVEPYLLFLHLLLQQRGLQGGLRARYQPAIVCARGGGGWGVLGWQDGSTNQLLWKTCCAVVSENKLDIYG